jgi:hypothetical protein
MRCIGYVAVALLTAAAVNGGPASANVCHAGRLICPTTMPVDGYCECRAHGRVESGTVYSGAQSRRMINAATGGCGSEPNAPGCRNER